MPPAKSFVKKEESEEDLFLAFGDIDWSQVSQTQFDAQPDTQLQTQQLETQAETQTTLVGGPSLVKLAHSSVSPPVRTISIESGSSTQTNSSTKTIVVDDEDVDYRALLEGAENFDWDDWGMDEENDGITTPRKPKSPTKAKKFTPVKPKNLRGMGVAGGGGPTITPPPYTKPCTRCIIVNITKYSDLDHPVQVSGLLPPSPRCLCITGKSTGIKRVILSLDAWSRIPNPLWDYHP